MLLAKQIPRWEKRKFLAGNRMSAKRRIAGFRQDEQGDWIAELECGHAQHMRHDPPWTNRPWVTTAEGRAGFLGHELHCVECETDSGLKL